VSPATTRAPKTRTTGLAKGALVPREHPWRVFLRGWIKHCGVCGSGHLFKNWFQMKERCPRCNLKFNRMEGQWSGDIGTNTVVMVAIGIAAVAVALIMPIFFLPYSKTLWLAVDLLMRPLEPGEVAEGYGPQRRDPASPPAP
jgi:uncharacterized protein (DUF983 family)